MKKTVLLLILVVSLGTLKAQESTESGSTGGLFIGTKVGYGIVNYESVIEKERNFALTSFNNISYGILTGYQTKGSVSFQVEANYSRYGARDIIPTYIYSPLSPLFADYGASSTVHRVDMDLFNLDVPLTIRFSLSKWSFSPYFYGGVNYGINIIGRTTIVRKVVSNDVIDYRRSHDNITDRVILNEFAPVIGFGIKKETLRMTFFGDVRYKYGFTNLSNVDNNLGFTNSALWISAGLYLGL